jgi:hypothetical protein
MVYNTHLGIQNGSTQADWIVCPLICAVLYIGLWCRLIVDPIPTVPLAGVLEFPCIARCKYL